VENFSQAVAHTAAIVLDLIPHVYDTPRTVRITGIDGKMSTVEVNKTEGYEAEDGTLIERKLNDLTVGAYDVVVSEGPSFATRRQEAIAGMTGLLQAAPDLAPIIIDLLARDQDWPSADEIAERVEAMLPPKIQALLAKKRGEPPPAAETDPAADAARAELDLKAREVDQGDAEIRIKALVAQASVLTAQANLWKAKAAATATPMPAGEDGAEPPGIAHQDPATAGIAAELEQATGMTLASLEQVLAELGAMFAGQNPAGAPAGGPEPEPGPPPAPMSLEPADGPPGGPDIDLDGLAALFGGQ
jgi:hypothetical protein